MSEVRNKKYLRIFLGLVGGVVFGLMLPIENQSTNSQC